MYKKKNKKNEYIFIIIPLVLALFIGLAFKITNDDRTLNVIEQTFKDCILTINKTLNKPINYFKKMNEENKDTKDLLKKYQELKEKEEQYELNEAKIIELENEIENLKTTLNLNSALSDSEAINATIINRNVGYWYDTITIDKGEKDGVLENMPVIVNEGLLGTITKTTTNNSVVKLLTGYSDNKISVKIQVGDNFVFGLLGNYDEKTKTFKIEGISENTDIEIGSIVLTTGLGNNYPSGILVGKVTNITTDNFDLTKLVEVKSDVDFDDINYVTILKKEENNQ